MTRDHLTPAERRALAIERQWALICPEVSSVPSSIPDGYRTIMRPLIDEAVAEEFDPVAVGWMRRKRDANIAAERHSPMMSVALMPVRMMRPVVSRVNDGLYALPV